MLQKIRFFVAYLQKPVWDTGISPLELTDFIKTHQPGKALDLGCGTGTNVITLAKQGWDVIGVDFAWQAIHAARKKAKQNGVHIDLRFADVTRMEPTGETFDLILDMGCFTSLPSTKRHAYILNIKKLLAESGTFLLYLFYKTDPFDQKPGVTEEDVQFITQVLKLVDRKDSTERGIRPSSWLTLQNRY